jgi:hypothetical protein
MKVFTTIASTIVLLTGISAAAAADQGGQALAVCEADILDYFGSSTEVVLVSQRQYEMGTRIKVAAKLDRDNSRFATCWVTANDIVALEEYQQPEMVVAASE